VRIALRIAAALVCAIAVFVVVAFVRPDLVRPYAPQALAAVLPGADEDSRPSRPTVVALAQVERGEAVDRFQTAADVIALEAVTVAAEITGRVVEVAVDDGARVTQGDALIRFDDAAERARLEAQQAQTAEARAEFLRAETLEERGVAAETRVETAAAALQTAEGELAAARQVVEDQVLRAPFDGAVGLVHVSPGAVLSPGDPVADLATVDTLRFQFELPTEAVAALAPGQTVRAPQAPEGCREAAITVISPLGNAETLTRAVEAAPGPSCNLSPGALVAVSVALERRPDALFAPLQAVIRRGFQAHVFRVEEGEDGLVARQRLVETGVIDGERVEIRSGLSAGDRVVARGHEKLQDGAPVAPQEDAGPGSTAPGSTDGDAVADEGGERAG
jgi:membrane fusion protein (multidrug efflux system)